MPAPCMRSAASPKRRTSWRRRGSSSRRRPLRSTPSAARRSRVGCARAGRSSPARWIPPRRGVAAPARAEAVASDDRAWLARALLVLVDPRPVFAALRDDSDAAARARQEPVLALVWLAGIASILWTSVARGVMDDPAFDGLVVAVWAFIGGAFYALAGYFAAGAALYVGLRAARSLGSFRRARHL